MRQIRASALGSQRHFGSRLWKLPRGQIIFARRRGAIWRWFIFEGDSGPVETGIVLDPDRIPLKWSPVQLSPPRGPGSLPKGCYPF